MKKKFKTWLIHLLGGVTQEESIVSDHNSYDMGVLTNLYHLRSYAERMNGMQAEEWCRRMYDHIINCIKTKETGS